MLKFVELEAGQNIEDGDYMPHKPEGRGSRISLFRCQTCEAVLFERQLGEHVCETVAAQFGKPRM